MRHILIFTLLLLSYTSVVSQTVPTVWGNTRIPVRSPNGDSTGYASVSQLFSDYGSGLSWNVGGNTVAAHSIFGTNSAYDLIFRTNSTERMRIESGGSVGIATTSPTAKLNINGDLRIRQLLSGASTDSIMTAGASGNVGKRNITSLVGTTTYNETTGGSMTKLNNVPTYTYKDIFSSGIGAGGETGVYVIECPFGWTNGFQSYKIKGYNYTGGQGYWETDVSFYNYSGGYFVHPSGAVSGTPPFDSVRLSLKNGKIQICLGGANTVWSYKTITVTEGMSAYNGGGYLTGWSGSISPNLEAANGFSATVQISVVPKGYTAYEANESFLQLNSQGFYNTRIANRYDAGESFYIQNANDKILGKKSIGLTSQTTYLSSYYDLAFATGAANPTNSDIKAVLLNNGNFGLGITNPTARFHIKATANSQAQIYVTNSANTIVKGESVNSAGGFDASYYTNAGTPYVNFDGNVSQTRFNGASYVGGYGVITNGNTLLTGGATTVRGADVGATDGLIVQNSYGTKTFSVSNNGKINLDGSQIIATSDASLELRNNATGALTLKSSNTYPILLNPTAGNVGIGTTAPSYKLHVVGNSLISNSSNDGIAMYSYQSGGTGTIHGAYNKSNSTSSTLAYGSYNISTGANSGTNVGAYFSASNATNNYALVTASGNVGIGTTTPTTPLDVNGKTKTTTLQVTTGATNNYVLQSDAIGNASWVAPSAVTSNASGVVQGGNSFGAITNIGTNDGYDLRLRTAGSTKMFITTAGNVGIGAIAPTNKLVVNALSEGNPLLLLGLQPSVSQLDSNIVIDGTGVLKRAEVAIRTVELYGAVGNGSTNDYTALQNAINAQRDVILKEGKTYVIGSQLITNHNTHIYGNRAIIKVVSGDFTPILIDGDTSVIIQDLIIQHNTNASNHALYSNTGSYDDMSCISIKNSSNNITIQNCKFYGFSNCGVIAHTSNNIKIVNNTSSQGVPVFITGADIQLYSTCNNVLISGNTLTSNVSTAISVGTSGFCEDVIIDNNIIKPTVSHAAAVSRSAIQAGYLTPALGSGRVTITNNQISNYGCAGIYTTAQQATIISNTITDVGFSNRNNQGIRGGIVVIEPQRTIISENIIRKVSDAGTENGDSTLIGGIVLGSSSTGTNNLSLSSDIKILNNHIDSSSGNGFVNYYKAMNVTFAGNTITNSKGYDALFSYEYNSAYRRNIVVKDNRFLTSGKGGIAVYDDYFTTSSMKTFDVKDNIFIAKKSGIEANWLVWFGLADSSNFRYSGNSYRGYNRAFNLQYQIARGQNSMTVKNESYADITQVMNHTVTSSTDNEVIFENCTYENCAILFYSDYNNIAGVGTRFGNNKTVSANGQVNNVYNGLSFTTTPSFGYWQQGDRIVNSDPSVKIKEWLCTNAGIPSTAVFKGVVSDITQTKKTGVTGTSLEFTGYNLGASVPQDRIKIFKNGVYLEVGSGNDYTVSAVAPITLTLATAAITTDKYILRIE